MNTFVRANVMSKEEYIAQVKQNERCQMSRVVKSA